MDDSIKIPLLCHLPPQVIKDFAGVRGRVLNAIKESPRSVKFSDAQKQVQLSLKEVRKS